MLSQIGDETPQCVNAPIKALDVLDSPGDLDLINCLDLIHVGLDSLVRDQVTE
jgi:hypothetical protein